MTRKSQLFHDLTFDPSIPAKLSPAMRAFLEEIKARAGPDRFSAETVAGALALANKGAAAT